MKHRKPFQHTATLIATCCALYFNAIAQNESNTWKCGYNLNVSFTDDSTVITHESRPFSVLGLCNTVIGDSAGNLLFYTDGLQVYNADNDTMPHGKNLHFYEDQYPINHSYMYGITQQSALIIPKEEENGTYYLFYILADLAWINAPVSKALRCAVVDMNLDNGKGDLIPETINRAVIEDSLGVGNIAAVKHANGEDWWVLVHKWNSKVYYRLLVKQDTIYGPYSQTINGTPNFATYNFNSIFTPDGNTYASSVSTNVWNYPQGARMYLFDFDRCTGLLSNLRSLIESNGHFAGEFCFSPNSRFLYTNPQGFIKSYLHQYDLQSTNLFDSDIIIDSSEVSQTGGFFFNMQIAPSGEIYIGNIQTPFFHVIHNPDEQGLSCNFEQEAISTGSNINYNPVSVPIYHNYSLQALPSYQASAGSDMLINENDTISIGSSTINGLIYDWEPAYNISNTTVAQPQVWPQISTTYTLTITDLNGNYDCAVRQDTVTITVIEDGITNELTVPTLIHANQTPEFKILNLPSNSKLEIFNYLGQVIYASENYLNNWRIKSVSAGLYLYRLALANGEVMKGKIVVIR